VIACSSYQVFSSQWIALLRFSLHVSSLQFLAHGSFSNTIYVLYARFPRILWN
jgi:hypothetical protein